MTQSTFDNLIWNGECWKDFSFNCWPNSRPTRAVFCFLAYSAAASVLQPLMAERKADISGVHGDWENSQGVRRVLVDSGSIFHGAPDIPDLNVKSACKNKAALIPLVKRLATSDGQVLMVAIPDLTTEILAKNSMIWFQAVVCVHVIAALLALKKTYFCSGFPVNPLPSTYLP